MHGIAIGGVVLFVVIMAVVARFALAGIGPFEGTVSNVAPDADGLAITLSVKNEGKSAGQTTCRVTDPADRTGNVGGFMLSPKIEPEQTLAFTQRVTALGTTVRPLVAECSSP